MFPPEDSHDGPSRAEIFGLATIAGHAGTNRLLRLKAIRALARIPDQNAIRVLGEMALWENDTELREEARRSLEVTFGDDLPEVLEGIRQELTGAWGPNKPEAGDELPAAMPQQNDFESEAQVRPQPGVQGQQVEGTPLWLLWVFLGLILIGGLLYIVFR